MRRERGVAAVTAILIVAIAASTAALMLSQQSAMIDQTLMVASRAQADLFAQAGLDWARGVLAEDARRAKDVDSLDEGWAQPIAALPVDRAVIAGAITDEQGKVNLNNLAPDGRRGTDEDMRIFRTLLGSLGLAPELADAVLDWIDRDSDLASGAGAEDSYYLALAHPYRAANMPMVQVEELYRVRGFDPATVAKVKPYVTALRGHTALNVNTASDVVLAAFLGLTREKAAAMVTERRTKPFLTKQQFVERARRDGAENIRGDFDVKSAFYSVRIQVAQDEVQLAAEALVKRADNATTAIIWRRPLY